MSDLFILCAQSNQLALKDFIPILLGISVFVGNIAYQQYNKHNNIRDKISSEVISICDKMIRYSVEAEYSALAWKYWTKMLYIQNSINDNDTNIKNAQTECTYYHRKLEDAGLKLDLLKSELKKFTKDLQKYWDHELQTRMIINVMVEAVMKSPRRFDDQLTKEYILEEELLTDYQTLIVDVEREVIFNGIGYDLVCIQKMIDPKSPTLLLSHAEEAELVEKFKNDKNKYHF